MAQVSFRIDDTLKSEADTLFGNMGMNLSTDFKGKGATVDRLSDEDGDCGVLQTGQDFCPYILSFCANLPSLLSTSAIHPHVNSQL